MDNIWLKFRSLTLIHPLRGTSLHLNSSYLTYSNPTPPQPFACPSWTPRIPPDSLLSFLPLTPPLCLTQTERPQVRSPIPLLRTSPRTQTTMVWNTGVFPQRYPISPLYPMPLHLCPSQVDLSWHYHHVAIIWFCSSKCTTKALWIWLQSGPPLIWFWCQSGQTDWFWSSHHTKKKLWIQCQSGKNPLRFWFLLFRPLTSSPSHWLQFQAPIDTKGVWWNHPPWSLIFRSELSIQHS